MRLVISAKLAQQQDCVFGTAAGVTFGSSMQASNWLFPQLSKPSSRGMVGFQLLGPACQWCPGMSIVHKGCSVKEGTFAFLPYALARKLASTLCWPQRLVPLLSCIVCYAGDITCSNKDSVAFKRATPKNT